MMKRAYLFALAFALLYGISAAAQHSAIDAVANKVIQKYQQSSCEQLWQQKSQPKSPEEQRAVQLLRSDPDVRIAFINQIAAPIANKLFDCGMIP
jgi:hypothetical protein